MSFREDLKEHLRHSQANSRRRQKQEEAAGNSGEALIFEGHIEADAGILNWIEQYDELGYRPKCCTE